jgi:hypothetical protein
MKWIPRAARFALLLALAGCGGEREAAPAPAARAPAEPVAAADAQPVGPPAPAPDAANAPLPPPTDFWLLREFDWGDSEDTVYESVDYTDGFLCYRHKLREHCAFVKTRVDGEELLANFHFAKKRLYRADILTPDLDVEQAQMHLERVWKLLVAYVTRFQGEAPEQAAFPDRTKLAPGEIRVTHHWSKPEQEIRIVVARAEDGSPRWYTAVRVVDPKWVAQEPVFVADAATPDPPARP